MKTTRFAVIESNSGFVLGVVDSISPKAACYLIDSIAGNERVNGGYEEVSTSELRTTRGAYDVHFAPAGFDVADGQNANEIAAVDALPRAGVFAWVDAE